MFVIERSTAAIPNQFDHGRVMIQALIPFKVVVRMENNVKDLHIPALPLPTEE